MTEYYTIRKNGKYYGRNYCGYTQSETSAGIYPKDEAIAYCKKFIKSNDKFEAIPVSEHNTYLKDAVIADLKQQVTDLQKANEQLESSHDTVWQELVELKDVLTYMGVDFQERIVK